MELCTHVCNIVSIMTKTTQTQALFFKLTFTSSLLKLANGSTHGDETWYAYHFDDDNKPSARIRSEGYCSRSCVCLSTAILALQATRRLMSDINVEL